MLRKKHPKEQKPQVKALRLEHAPTVGGTARGHAYPPE